MNHKRGIRYPIYQSTGLLDRTAAKFGFGGVAYCPVCGHVAPIIKCSDNLRESCICMRCKSTNRQRQTAYIICQAVSAMRNRRIRSLRGLAGIDGLSVYNTESQGAVHNFLSRTQHYVCSEYFGPEHASGEHVGGVLHEDMMHLSFEDESFDLLVSSDVLEHVPEPYRAHGEIYRILKAGGRHVFTVPFLQTAYLDDQRATIEKDGKVLFLKDPLYHEDPIRPEGALVYTIFSLQMLVELRRLGFRTNMYLLYKPWHGILGSNAIIFEAIKQAADLPPESVSPSIRI